MEEKIKKPDAAAPTELASIEVLAQKHGLSPGTFAGLKVHMGWAKGKEVTEKAFLDAAKAFGSASILGVK